jgi:hypothetical protein
MKNKVIIEVDWCKNYGACPQNTAVCCCVTAHTLEDLKRDMEESLRWHIQSMKQDGDDVPHEFAGEYELEYSLTAAALLRHCTDGKTTLTAIGKASGINMRQLSAYVQNRKKPRPAQYKRIVAGIKSIAKELSSCCCT